MSFAHDSTLFLYEIGDLPLGVQASLLRALDTQTYRRFNIQMPSIGECREDLPLPVDYFLTTFESRQCRLLTKTYNLTVFP